MEGKVIILDYGMYLHTSIFAWRNNKAVPATYTCMNMITSHLRKIGVEPYDTIIVACDYGHSWRKKYEGEYKANRKEFRESYEDINWKEMYASFNKLIDDIDAGSGWYVVKQNSFEADDWMAVACRYYKDREVILVTFDSDMEQLVAYPNVKIFSPKVKIKGKKGGYKVIKNPYAVVAKKIGKEVSDNLTNPVISKQDFENRKTIVNLLELPDFVEQPILEKYKELEHIEKEENLELIPFKNIREKMSKLYNDKNNIVTYQECLEYAETKKRRKKNARDKKKHARRSKK